MADPSDEFRQVVSRAEVAQVDYQVEMLAQRVYQLDTKFAVLQDRYERMATDYSELKRRQDDLEQANRTLAAKEDERRGERNSVRAIAALAIATIGGIVSWFLSWLIPHH